MKNRCSGMERDGSVFWSTLLHKQSQNIRPGWILKFSCHAQPPSPAPWAFLPLSKNPQVWELTCTATWLPRADDWPLTLCLIFLPMKGTNATPKSLSRLTHKRTDSYLGSSGSVPGPKPGPQPLPSAWAVAGPWGWGSFWAAADMAFVNWVVPLCLSLSGNMSCHCLRLRMSQKTPRASLAGLPWCSDWMAHILLLI